MTIMTVMSVSSHRGLGERQHTAGGRRRRNKTARRRSPAAYPLGRRQAFRASGKMCWTSTGESHGLGSHLPLRAADLVATRTFFYVRAETDDLLFFVMVNQLFTLVTDVEPSNHLHSILIPKSFLAHPNGYGPGVTCSLPGVDCSSGQALPAANAAAPWHLMPSK